MSLTSLSGSIQRFEELDTLTASLEAALQHAKDTRAALGTGSEHVAVQNIRRALQSASSAMAEMKGMLGHIVVTAKATSRASYLRTLPDVLMIPQRPWTHEFAALSAESYREKHMKDDNQKGQPLPPELRDTSVSASLRLVQKATAEIEPRVKELTQAGWSEADAT
eukprot:4964167-Prymnesium_polylepis.1